MFHKPSVVRRLAHRATNPGAAAAPDSGSAPNDGNGNSGNGTDGNGSNSQSNGQGSDQGSGSSVSSSSSSDTTTTPSTTSQPAQSTADTTTSQSSSSSSVVQAASSSVSSSPASSTTANAPTVTPTSSSTSPTATSKTSSSSSTSSSSTAFTSLSTSTHVSTFTPTVDVETSSFASVSRIFSSSSVVAAEATSSSKPSGAINTGAIVGSIAGALAGLAILGFLVAFFMRRINRRNRARKFEAAQFRRSAMLLDDEPLPMPRPPEMIQNRGNNYTDSVTSTTSPGMAGAGAYRLQQDNGPDNGLETQHEYYRDNGAQQYHDESSAPAVPMQRTPLQPRQQYTFGRAPTETHQPAAQNVNPFVMDNYDGEAHNAGQAYGQFTAYSPSQSPHAAGAHPSALANRSSIASKFDESDAYGGM